MFYAVKKRGFTLIELLVVIAIIALLAAILFPVFAKAREKSFQSTCSNNQRQIAVSIMMYVQDNDETFFPDPVNRPWSAMTPVNNAPGLFHCPTQSASTTGTGTGANPEYCMNNNLFSRAYADLTQPSATLLTSDFNQSKTNFNCSTKYFSSNEVSIRHDSGTIVSCVDGHCNYVKLTSAADTRFQLVSLGYITALKTVQLFSIAGPLKLPTDTGGYTGNAGNYQTMGTAPYPVGAYLAPTATTIPDFVFEYDWNVTFDNCRSVQAVNFFDPQTTTPLTGASQANYAAFQTWSNAFSSIQVTCGIAPYGEGLNLLNTTASQFIGGTNGPGNPQGSAAGWMSGNGGTGNGLYHVKLEILNNGTGVTLTTTFKSLAPQVMNYTTTTAQLLPIMKNSALGFYVFSGNHYSTATTMSNFTFSVAQ